MMERVAEHGDRVQRSGSWVRAPVVLQPGERAAALLKPGDFDWKAIFGQGVRCSIGGIFSSLSETTSELLIER